MSETTKYVVLHSDAETGPWEEVGTVDIAKRARGVQAIQDFLGGEATAEEAGWYWAVPADLHNPRYVNVETRPVVTFDATPPAPTTEDEDAPEVDA